MTNIKDLAKMAGVSVTTVSRVLNNHPYVSAEKGMPFQRRLDRVITDKILMQSI